MGIQENRHWPGGRGFRERKADGPSKGDNRAGYHRQTRPPLPVFLEGWSGKERKQAPHSRWSGAVRPITQRRAPELPLVTYRITTVVLFLFIAYKQ